MPSMFHPFKAVRREDGRWVVVGRPRHWPDNGNLPSFSHKDDAWEYARVCYAELQREKQKVKA